MEGSRQYRKFPAAINLSACRTLDNSDGKRPHKKPAITAEPGVDYCPPPTITRTHNIDKPLTINDYLSLPIITVSRKAELFFRKREFFLCYSAP